MEAAPPPEQPNKWFKNTFLCCRLLRHHYRTLISTIWHISFDDLELTELYRTRLTMYLTRHYKSSYIQISRYLISLQNQSMAIINLLFEVKDWLQRGLNTFKKEVLKYLLLTIPGHFQNTKKVVRSKVNSINC